MPTNQSNQPIGSPVTNWSPPPRSFAKLLSGQYCRLEVLSWDSHGEQLYKANRLDSDQSHWTYLPYGPPSNLADYKAWVNTVSSKDDDFFYAIIDSASNKAVGVASYIRIQSEFGSVEVGHLNFSPLLQRTKAATEAMYLMMKQAFELGYRRYEWKCDSLNAPSRAAAQRLGFSFEGVFRQALVYKGRNRDTAWFSVIDSEWPSLERGLSQWLDESNFDDEGKQHKSLSSFI